MRRVGVLMAWLDTDQEIQARVAAFRQELGKLGWSEGVNLQIEERFGGDDMDHLRAQATELIEFKVDAILVGGRRAVAVLRQQTRSVPIVLAGISDPAGQGLVASLARPGEPRLMARNFFRARERDGRIGGIRRKCRNPFSRPIGYSLDLHWEENPYEQSRGKTSDS
jgi:putative ABC transport system substrate-binding protein